MASRLLSRWLGGLVMLGALHGVAATAAPAQERKVGLVTGLAGEATVVHASPPPAPCAAYNDA